MKKKLYFNHTKISTYQYIIGCLFGSLFFAIPLIVFLRVAPLSHELLSYYPTIDGYIVDLSLFYKSRAFVFVATFLFLIFIGERIYPEQKIHANILKYNNRKYLLLSLLFIVCIIISFLFSEHQSISLWGAPNSYEGTLVWILYLIVFLMSLNYFENDFYYKFIKNSIVLIMIVFCPFGLFEYFVTSPLEMPLFQYLILPRDYWDQIGNLDLTSYFGNISLTLSNPSYVGQFLVLILPILFTMGQKSKDNKENYILLRLLSGMGILLLLLSGATAALYAFIIGLMIQFILHKRDIKKQIVSSLLIAAFLIGITLPFYSIEIFSGFLGDFQKNSFSINEEYFPIKDILLTEEGIHFKGSKNEFTLKYNLEDDEYYFYSKDTEIDYIKKDHLYQLTENDFKNVQITDYGNYFAVDLGYKAELYFTVVNNEYKAIGPNGQLIDEIHKHGAFDLSHKQLQFATGRGYIWNISLPLLKETILKGYGADTLVFHIPQNDFAGKLNYHGSANMIIDKPHNMYLQIALQSGMMALLSFVLILAFYYISCFKNIKRTRNFDCEHYSIFVAMLSGITSYLICGFFYDSSIAVAPAFWVFLGIGICMNNKIQTIQDYKNSN